VPRQARQLAESQIYHVMVRGVNRDAIFLEDEDYQRFLDALDQTREASGCVVLAYCLMSNHVHLVLRTPGEPISAVAKRLGVRYAGWFNRKYGRVGHVFQDRFRSLPVETDEYLVTLVRYVWNNPVEAGLVEDPREYPWSSRRFLVGGSSLVDVAALLRLVPSGAFESDAAPVSLPALIPAVIGRPQRHTDQAAIDLLLRWCGVGSPDAFARLDPQSKCRAIAALRTHGVAYSQIGLITGLSTSTVRRVHASGPPAEGWAPAAELDSRDPPGDPRPLAG